MIGKNIQSHRRKAGLTQWQLAQALNIRPGTLLLIERGQKDCPRPLLQAIATVLGVSERELKR